MQHRQRFEPWRLLALAALLSLPSATTLADLAIPGADGSGGAFAPTESIEVDLSLSPTAAWDSPGSGNGVYDPDKWAVVFKYSAVDIPEGVTVTFKNHPSRAPVVWLVNGDASIAGTVDLNGHVWVNPPDMAEPGPGGFRGAIGSVGWVHYPSGGFGIGGGNSDGAYGGNHATVGHSNEAWPTYGTERVLPLIGGSGGGGHHQYAGYGGAGGGGALVLAVSGTLAIDGQVTANGGGGYGGFSGPGGGGAIRLIADAVTGTGALRAVGGSHQYGVGGAGRIRIEATNADASWDINPVTTLRSPDDPIMLWPPEGAPSVRVVSVGEVVVPADPRASFDVGHEDGTIGLDAPEQIVLETTNVDPAATVQVRITPQIVPLEETYQPSLIDAEFQSGNRDLGTWIATGHLPEGHFAVQAHAVNPAP